MLNRLRSSDGVFAFIIVAFGAVALVLGGGRAVAQQIAIETVALDGDPAPGADAGSTFFTFNDVGAIASGIAFRAFLRTAGFNDCDEGLWVGPASGVALVACEGFPAPDTEAGTTFVTPGGGFPGTSVANDIGQVAFPSRLRGIGVGFFDDEGIWLGSPGSVRLLAREGDQAPGTPPGVEFIGLSSAAVRLNDAGQVAFAGSLVGPGVNRTNDRGIWLGSLPENLALVAREGDPAPGTAPGVVFSDILNLGVSREGAVVNDAGEVALLGVITGPGVTFANNRGIWIGAPGNLRLAVRSGDQVPGLPPGSTFVGPFAPTLNNAGEIAFLSRVSFSSETHLWVGDPNLLTLVVRTGDPAPGTDPGVTFSGLFPPVLGGNGDVAFRATVTAPSSEQFGIWAGGPDVLELLDRGSFSTLGSFSLNGAGDVAFDSSDGVWLKPRFLPPIAVALPGGMIEVGPGDFRTVAVADLGASESGNDDGRRSSLSDSGEVAFRVSFTDGSRGIFLAALPVVGGDDDDDDEEDEDEDDDDDDG